VAPFLPKALLQLPASDEAFAGPAEMLAHHAACGRDDAEAALERTPVAELVLRQMHRTTNRYHAVPT
jgi:hypothetical protein